MIHLIVGNTGSGKTTYSKKLQQTTNGIIFSIDKWNKTLFLPDKSEKDSLEWFLERIERSERIILDLIKQLENSDTDSILDLGLAKKSHRQKFIDFAKENEYKATLHYLNVDKQIRLERVMNRNSEKGDTYEFEVTKENFDFMESWFEPPTDEELKNAIVIEE